ncbi:MAG: cysteine hydrolase [Deltaproteobacteria bacterium]|nr:cysteine hydrolase [Deltaproteobacteria bacterium]MBW2069356.1 cysteine hydrolase [Deltaproteobacteria bacterium]
MAERVLIVVDMLNDFVHPDGKLYCGQSAQAIIEPSRKIIEHFRAKKDPIIYLQDSHSPDDLEFQMFPPHAIKGTWGCAIIEELSPRAGEAVVPKTRFSGFFRTDLEQRLEAISSTLPHKPEVWVIGVCTSICVMDTVADLRNRDYPVVVVLDAVSDFDQEMHECALKRMERVYKVKFVKSGEIV